MDALSYFDSEDYFSKLCQENRLAVDAKFHFCTCSGIQSLQGPLDRFRTANAFFCIDDTNDGALFQGKGGGWFKKRTFTVFLLHRYSLRDETARMSAMSICRKLFNQIMSRLIVDADDMKKDMIFLHTGNVMSRELGQYFLNGCTGLYFMIDVSEPVNLIYRTDEWLN